MDGKKEGNIYPANILFVPRSVLMNKIVKARGTPKISLQNEQ